MILEVNSNYNLDLAKRIAEVGELTPESLWNA